MPNSRFAGGELPSSEEIKAFYPYGEYDLETPPLLEENRARLQEAGMDVMSVLLEDDSLVMYVYKTADTPQAYIAGVLFQCEYQKILTRGSLQTALEDLYAGEFDTKWGEFYSRIPTSTEVDHKGDW